MSLRTRKTGTRHLWAFAAAALFTLTVASSRSSSHSSMRRAPRVEWRLPGDFEPLSQMLISWDENYAEFFAETISAAYGRTEIVLVVDPEVDLESVESHLRAYDLSLEHLKLLKMRLDSVWLRDFGPMVVHARKKRRVVDFYYQDDRTYDDAAGELIAKELWPGVEYMSAPYELEGGNLLSNGRGVCVSASDDPAVRLPDLERALREYLGCRRIVILEALEGEPTGHVDMFTMLASPRVAIVGHYDPLDDEINAEILDRNAARLRRAGFKVLRIPMPPNRDGLYRTYTNSLVVNDAILVPVYSGYPDHEAEAFAVLGRAFPNLSLEPIDSTNIIDLDGAVHCATMNVGRF